MQLQGKPWNFNVTDVGGQRSERRKWMKVFNDVDCVLYVMSLSGYDQVIFEDHETRCFDETLGLFQETIKHKVFDDTDFVVFFNKVLSPKPPLLFPSLPQLTEKQKNADGSIRSKNCQDTVYII